MDYVSEAVHDAQQRLLNGPLRLTLDDQAHFHRLLFRPRGCAYVMTTGKAQSPALWTVEGKLTPPAADPCLHA